MRFTIRLGTAPLVFLILALLLSACGGGGDDGSAPPLMRTTQEVGASGGTLSIDGATLGLEAGALSASTAVSLESLPLDEATGARLRLRLTPAGVRLTTESRLTITLTGAGTDIAAYWMVDGTPLLANFSRSGDEFVVRLRSLGFDADGRRISKTRPLAEQQARDERKRALADGPSAGELRLAALDCQQQARHLKAQLGRLASSEDAIAQFDQFGEALLATVQRCQALEVQQVQQAACEEIQAAAEDLVISLPTSTADMNRKSRRLLGANAAVQKASATCEPMPDVNALIADRMADFLAVLSGQIRRGDLASRAGARELGVLFAIEADCQVLELGAACDRLRTQIFPDLLDGMRAAAFNECRSRGTSLPVAQFLDLTVDSDRNDLFMGLGRFRTSEVEADLMQCTAPQLGVRVFETVSGSPQALPGRDVILQPMRAFNDYRTRAEVRVPRDGHIVLEGPVAVARCPDGNALGAELVVLTASSPPVEVARRAHNGTRFTLDSQPIDLSVQSLLLAARLDPASATNVGLIVRQEGGYCVSRINPDRQVLDQPVPLFQLDLRLDAAGIGATTWSGSVSVDVAIVATLRGERNRADSLLDTARVAELTTETLDLNFGYSLNLPVVSGTELLPGIPVRLQGALPANLTATGSARVDSAFTFVPGSGCVETRADTARLSGSVATGGATEATIELMADGRLRIGAGGLRGAYRASSEGTKAGNNCRFSPFGSFTQPFGPQSVSDEFLDIGAAQVLTSVAGNDGQFAGIATARKSFLGSTAACESFLRTHMRSMSLRLIESERVVKCEQVVQLNWQLVRD